MRPKLHVLFFIFSVLHFITAMNATTQKKADQLLDIHESSTDSLSSKIDSLTHSANWWNNGYLGLVAFAVLVGGVTAYFQYTAVKKARLLADAEGELRRVKELQLGEELKNKDLQIAQLNKATAELDKIASDARERAAKAESHLADANARITEASARAKEAEARVAEANAASKEAVAQVASAQARIAEANRAAAEANRIAENERLERIEIQKQLAPRILEEPDREALGQQLRRFAPNFSSRKVKLSSYSGDTEGIVFSLQILDVLTRAGIAVDPAIGRMIPLGLVTMGVRATGPIADGEFIRSLLAGIRANVENTRVHGEWHSKYEDVTIQVGVKPIAGLPEVVPQAK